MMYCQIYPKIEIFGKRFLGEGANWMVSSCRLSDIQTEAVVSKERKSGTAGVVGKNLQNYDVVKALGLPTLSFLEGKMLGDQPVLIGEDLSASEQVFVSPNSVDTAQQRMLQESARSFGARAAEKKESVAELFRYTNKISSIVDFEGFILRTKQDLEQISSSLVEIDFDSYFFGTNRYGENSSISYKIVDFDNIFQHTSKRLENELISNNQYEFSKAIMGFLEHFVEHSQIRTMYANLVKKHLRE